nr:DNA repair protein RecO [Desulfuromonadales bacterium]
LVDLRAGLRSDLTAIALAGYGCELTEKLLHEGQSHAEVYHLLRALLDHVAEAGGSFEARLLFELRLLHLSGYAPHLGHCSECGGGLPGEEAWFSAEHGGSLCGGCVRGKAALSVYPPILGTLARCLQTPMDLFAGFRFSARTVTEATGVLGDALRQHLSAPPKSLTFLEQALAEADRDKV